MQGPALRARRRMRADLRAALDDGEPAAIDERTERIGEHRPERLVDGIHLEEDDLVLDEELVEYIHRRDRRHVAAAEDEAHAALGLLLAIDRALRRRLAFLDPDVCRDAHEEE